MPNPSPIYTVSYAGSQLPGYVQTDDRPLSFGSNKDKVFGRDGAIVTPTGTNLREISLSFLLKSSLGSGFTGLQHLDNVMNQYRTAVEAVSRPYGENELTIHDSDRYYLATVESMSMPLNANQSRSIVYTVAFSAQPWAISTVALTGSFTGNVTDATISGMTGSRRTYPIITIPTDVTNFTMSDQHGHAIEFVRDTAAGGITVDCADMRVYRTTNFLQRMETMANLNFGLFYDPTEGDTFTYTVTDFAGSGTVSINLPKRYEL